MTIEEEIYQIIDRHTNIQECVDLIMAHIINTPHTVEFENAMKVEMVHHTQRWGDERGVPPHHFMLVLQMISGKLAMAVLEKDAVKFEHHLITLTAVSGTFHKYFYTEGSEVSIWFGKTK